MTNSKVHSFAIAQHLYIFVIVFLLQLYSVLTYKWIFFDEANKTPNPQDKKFFGVCGVSSSSYLCDPDRILTVKGRQRVSQRLQLLEKQTANPNGTSECERRGIRLGIALSRRKFVLSHWEKKIWGNAAAVVAASWYLDFDCFKYGVLVYIQENGSEFEFDSGHGSFITDQIATFAFQHQYPLRREGKVEEALIGFVNMSYAMISCSIKLLLNVEIHTGNEILVPINQLSGQNYTRWSTWYIILLSATVSMTMITAYYYKNSIGCIIQRMNAKVARKHKNVPDMVLESNVENQS
ncbi:modulator of levamisole receptor-1 domain-containing protein [Ditylenchus destructor]|uniref:Modulator of levamisole receptor-1 domain-containing protein n=1 Tax=Ditylenchus destructor TaxID=166010 RepID=A0AAD4N031_9BILA|nr:modulator of levamisole receptor-1 domain-containing protein [Ditylenchus destructor]